MFAHLPNGIRLFYEDIGEGKDTVVLIHHLAGSINSWKYIRPKLAEKFRVIAYDLRGHGRSSTPPEPYKIENHSEDLKELLEQLEIKEPILIGHSIGSLIAIDYAINNKVKKLVLIGALYKAPAPEPYLKFVSIATSLGMSALAEYRRKQGDFASSLVDNITAWRDLISVYNENTPLGFKYAVEGLISANDYSPYLSKINAKTLLIYGSEDKLSANIPTFQSNMKNLTLKVLNGYGHFLNFEAPELLTNIILEFLSDSSS